MKLTKVEEEGLRLAMTLATHGAQLSLPELAEKEQLSEALVAKILGRLRQGGIVKAVRGRKGGYELAGDPSMISVGEILQSLGRSVLEGCFNRPVAEGEMCCPHGASCGLRPVWRKIESHISRVMSDITLADLIRPEGDVAIRLEGLAGSVESGEESSDLKESRALKKALTADRLAS